MDWYFDPRRLGDQDQGNSENIENSENPENMGKYDNFHGNSVSDTQFHTVSRPISKSEDNFLNDDEVCDEVYDDSFENENDDPNNWTLSLGRKGEFNGGKRKNSHHNRSISADILGMRDEQVNDEYTPKFPPKRTPSKSSSSPRRSISNNVGVEQNIRKKYKNKKREKYLKTVRKKLFSS